MTEIQDATGTCIMGASTEHPCTYPAAEPMHRFARPPETGPELCAFHAATEPLVDESDEMGVCLELVRAYLKGPRNQPCAAPLVEALERIETDFCARR